MSINFIQNFKADSEIYLIPPKTYIYLYIHVLIEENMNDIAVVQIITNAIMNGNKINMRMITKYPMDNYFHDIEQTISLMTARQLTGKVFS